MQRRTLGINAALLALLGAGCGPPPPSPPIEEAPAAATVQVVTWNVRRLFDARCDSGRCGEGRFEALPTTAELDHRLDEVAAVLRGMAPDVALLQEIETAAVLDSLSARLSDDLPYRVFGESGGDASLDVAVLSAHPVLETWRHADRALTRSDGSPTRFSRELLEARMEVHGRQVAAFTAHFRSKNDDDPERRLAEAIATAGIVAGASSDADNALVVLGGDLNDTPGSPPLEALEREGALQRVAAELDDAAAATYTYRGVPVALDHLFVAPTPGARYVPGSARVVREVGGSDHAALLATFSFR